MEQNSPAAQGPLDRGVRPRAWLCELAQEDGTTSTQFVEQDPDGLRWNDAGDPSPYRTTPLYEAPRWMPIETAPHDGTTVLLAAPGRVTVGEWSAEQLPTASEYHATTGVYIGEHETGECIEAAWVSWDGGFTDENPPTHWMPMPKQPTLGGGYGPNVCSIRETRK